MQIAKILVSVSLFAFGCSTAVVESGGKNTYQTVETDASGTSAKADVSNPQGADVSSTEKPDSGPTTDPPPQTGCATVTIYHDADGDGYGTTASAILHCADQPIADDWSKEDSDCNDSDPSVFPNIFEMLIDGKDNDCDGKTDNVEPYSCSNCKPDSHCVDPDNDGLGFCESNVCDNVACSAIDGYCDNNNVCTKWCTSGSNDGCLSNEECFDTNGNGYGDLCYPVKPAGATSPKGVCSGTNLFVPYNCPTIQAAVDAAPSSTQCPLVSKTYSATIHVMSGKYDENIVVEKGRRVEIVPYSPGKIIVNGKLDYAIEVSDCSSLKFSNLFVVNDMDITNSAWPATIFLNLGGAIEVFNSTISTKSIGIMTGYSWWTRVENTIIVGNGPHQTVGLDLEFENEPTLDGNGAHIYNNTFQNLSVGISWCVGTVPKLSPTSGDSNTYQYVGKNMQGSSNMSECMGKLAW